MKKSIHLFLFLSVLFLSCNGQTIKSTSITPLAFAEKIKSTDNPQIIDVRTPTEFADQHLENAVNVNWNGDNFVSQAKTFDKSKPVFVYCLSGGRSKQAASKLEELGFSAIYELRGGIMKWNAEGFAKPSNKIIGICSQEFNDLLKSDKKVLINFYAEWCAPCKKMAPYVKTMQTEFADDVTIIRLDADKNKTLITEMKISELPTLLLYDKKEMKWRQSGFVSEDDLRKQIQ